jgi:hypothetical protein
MERRTKYGIFLLVFLIAGLAIYGILYQLDAGVKDLAKADIHISAPGLTASFEGNEGLADSLYLYKVLSVSGVIQQLIDDGSGKYIVRLSGDRSGKTMVDCHLDSLYTRDDLLLRAGDSVTVRGTCAGQWVNVILLQCIIEKYNM